MFGALRQGSNVWVLDKSNMTLKCGSVSSTTQPTAYNNMQWMAQMPGQTIDIVVAYDDGSTNEFKLLQPSMAVATYGNVILAETQEVMAKEIDTLERQSKSVLESVAFHQKALVAYDNMKKMLSPSYRKEKETDDRLTALEGGIKSIQEMLASMANKASVKTKD